MVADAVATQTRPNILILMADQFRADLVGARAAATGGGAPLAITPVMDRLAAAGASFTRAYTACPLCTPARGALFTGRYPHANGLTANAHYAESPTPRLRDEEHLLFQHLAPLGYRSGYVGKWHLGWGKGDEGEKYAVGDEAAEARGRGVRDFFNGAAAARLQRERLKLPPRDDVGKARQRTMLGDHPPMSGTTPYPADYHLDSCIAGQTVDLLRTFHAEGRPDRPFAAVCSFHGPHFPIEVPEPYASAYDPRQVPKPGSFHDSFRGKPQGQRTHPWLQLASHLCWKEWQRVIAHYWGFASFIDSLMGRVLDELHALGLAERTIVLVTADHGEMAAHHRMFDKDPYFYEDVVRVPFIWRWPGHVPAQDGPTSQLVSHVDVVPTLLELAGATPAPDAPPLQGQSLVPALREGAAARAAVFCETTIGDLPNPQINARMILRGDWKYVYRLDDTDELYDLCRDSDEMANLASSPEHEPIRRDLAEALAAWMRVTADPLPPPSPIRQTPGA